MEVIRYGGPQGEDSDDAKRKAEERERKKAEVRKRLEEQSKTGKKQKKGFLTPERKKKLRKLLMMKAAEDLKQQQMKKEQERQKALAERTIKLPDVDKIDDHGKLEQIYNEMFARLCKLEEEKYDINQFVLSREREINELNIAVNDLRGKFVKPPLKKVSKYDNRFKKMADQGKSKEAEKKDFRTNLKTVKKESVITQISNKKQQDKPAWSKDKKSEKKEEAPAPEPQVAAPPPPAEEEEADEEEEEEE